MRAVLVRIGVDHSYGEWNAPVDPKTGDFVFVPIPESQNTRFHRGMERCYDEFLPALNRFCDARDLDLRRDLGFPTPLLGASMHLDPDFECLTYGNRGNPKGGIIQNLEEDDLLVFYAGLRS